MSSKQKYNWKRFLFDIHLWLGLGSGIIVSILCLTGFYLAFHPTVEEWINRKANHRIETTALPSVSDFLGMVQTDSEDTYTAIQIPTDLKMAWVLREGRRSTLFEPATGVQLKEPQPFLDGSYRFCFRLHRWLLLERSAGRTITGAATVVFLVTLMSGVILWVQKTAKNRKRGLWFKKGVGWKRLNYDTHLILGLYASIPLFVMGFTGLFWSYRTPFVTTVYRVLDGTSPPAPQERKEEGQQRLTVYDLPYETVRAYFAERFPEPGTLTIYFPKDGDKTFRATKRRDAGFGRLPVTDEVFFSVQDGDVKEEKFFSEKSRAQKFLSLVKAIHLGEFYGLFSTIIYLLCTAIGTTIPISGTIMWWNRIKWRFRRGSRKPIDPVTPRSLR